MLHSPKRASRHGKPRVALLPALLGLLLCPLLVASWSATAGAEDAETPSSPEILPAEPIPEISRAEPGKETVLAEPGPEGAPAKPGVTLTAASEVIASVYERVAPAVVGLTCQRGRTEFYFGTGTLLDPAGLIATSTTVVPKDGAEIRVFLQGGAVRPADLLLAEDEDEISLLRISGAAEWYPYVELGDSSLVQLGELALTFGNSFQSIQSDDQVSLGKGVVSGFYDLEETYSQSKYSGPAIETSAPLNSGTDGGPLIDRTGRLIGILSLNYSRSRWLGTAVPIDRLKRCLWEHLGVFSDTEAYFPIYMGLSAVTKPEGVVEVTRVEPGGPASAAGIGPGDRILRLGEANIRSAQELRSAFRSALPADALALELEREGQKREASIPPWRRF